MHKKIVSALVVICFTFLLCSCFGTGEEPTVIKEEKYFKADVDNLFVTAFDPIDGSEKDYGGYKCEEYEEPYDIPAMGYEHYGYGIKMRSDSYLTYDLSEKKVDNISFYCGPYQLLITDQSYSAFDGATYNMDKCIMQVLDAENDNILWEQKIFPYYGPQFVNVKVTGVNKVMFRTIQNSEDSSSNFAYAFAQITYWEGASKATQNLYPVLDKTTEFKDNYKVFYSTSEVYFDFTNNNFNPDYPITITNKKYPYGLVIKEQCLYAINLHKQFKQISFVLGHLDNDTKEVESSKRVWFQFYADDILLEEVEQYEDMMGTRFVYDVNYAQTFRIVFQDGEHSSTNKLHFGVGDFKGGNELTNEQGSGETFARPISLIKTMDAYVSNNAIIYKNESTYKGVMMGGKGYSTAIRFRPRTEPISGGLENATAAYPINKMFKNITFLAGHIDHTANYKGCILVMCDGVEKKRIPFTNVGLPVEVSINVENVSKLEFVAVANQGNNADWGIANIIAYPGEVTNVNLFNEMTVDDYDNTINMLDYFSSYCEYFPGKNWEVIESYNLDNYYYSGDTASHYFTSGGKEYKQGFIVQSSYGLDYNGINLLDMCFINAAIGVGTNTWAGFFCFNIGGMFSKLEFDTNSLDSYSYNESTEIRIYGDNDNSFIYSSICKKGELKHHTVDLTALSQNGVKPTRIIVMTPGIESTYTQPLCVFNLTLTK